MEKIKIAICDDSDEERELTIKVCQEQLEYLQEQYEYEILQFSDGEEFLEYKERIDLLILDIEMPKLDGIQLKNTLQNKNSEALIIFVTSHDEIMQAAFGKNVYGFVIKNQIREQLKKMLRDALDVLGYKMIYIDGISCNNIIYIQAAGNYSKIILKNGEEKLVRRTMDELESELENVDFGRSHRKYLVNFQYVTEVKTKEFVMDTITVEISNRMKTKIKKKYDMYCKKMARYC